MKLWVIRTPTVAPPHCVRPRRLMPERNNYRVASGGCTLRVPRRPCPRPRSGRIAPSVARSIPF